MSTADDWQRAFAKQAKADFDTWERLQADETIPRCHKLLFLQMACEKVVKAHLCGAGSDPDAIQGSHAYLGKNFQPIARIHYARRHKRAPDHLLRQMCRLAREVELLSPAVDDGGSRRDNCEYPWKRSDGSLCVPANYSFPNLSLLTELPGRVFLKIVRDETSELL